MVNKRSGKGQKAEKLPNVVVWIDKKEWLLQFSVKVSVNSLHFGSRACRGLRNGFERNLLQPAILYIWKYFVLHVYSGPDVSTLHTNHKDTDFKNKAFCDKDLNGIAYKKRQLER